MTEKKEWESREIEAMVRMAERNPNLTPAFDDATGGAVSAQLNNKPDGRGGKREGAGRPALPKGEKASERVMINLTPSELKRVQAQALQGEDRNGSIAKRLLLERVEQAEEEGHE